MSKGCSGVIVRCAPEASPAFSAIQPACRPITSTSSTRWCDSAVVCSRSIRSVAMLTAVSKPNVRSVPWMSLSIVFGMPITGTPSEASQAAAVSVPSPPIGSSASTPWASSTSRIRPRPSRSFCGATRADPSTVPPRVSSPLTTGRSSTMASSSSRPRQPFAEADDGAAVLLLGRADDGPQDGVESGAVAAAGQHSDVHVLSSERGVGQLNRTS